jgi:SPP1 family predicted phage head-tail adaptor
MPRLGSFRESLALQRNAEATSTGTGRRTPAWSTYATVAAEYIQPTFRSMGESFAQDAVVAKALPMFRLRYRTDVRAKDRVLWRGQTLQIHGVVVVMKVGNRYLELVTGQQQ